MNSMPRWIGTTELEPVVYPLVVIAVSPCQNEHRRGVTT